MNLLFKKHKKPQYEASEGSAGDSVGMSRGAFARVVLALARPVRAQWAFFVMSFLMLVYPAVEGLLGSTYSLGNRLFYFFQALFIALGVAYVATVVVGKVGKWWLKALLYALFWALLTITLLLDFNFGWKISEEAVTIMFETNPSETGEFLNTYAFTSGSKWAYGISALAIVLVVALEWLVRKAKKRVDGHTSRRRWVDCSVAALDGVGMLYMIVCYVWLAMCGSRSSAAVWDNYFPHESLDIMSQTLQSFNCVRVEVGEVRSSILQAQKVYDTHPTIKGDDSLTVVYVLGESYNKHHASIYGYSKPTTPNLEKERDGGNLFVFNDALSFENYTSTVQKNSFSLNCVSEGEYWFDSPMFTTIFKRSGYDVWMWDMQRSYSPEKLVTITVNSMMYNDEIAAKSYTACNDTTYTFDGTMVKHFGERVKFSAPYNLVVFHLLGQHVSYHFRFPKRLRHFNSTNYSVDGTGYDKNAVYTLANYDNATYYNDMVMKQIFDLFRHSNAVVVYMSDHGEEVYDYRNRFGRHQHATPTPAEMRYQNEVPFMIWCSDRYMQLHPDVVQRIKSAVDRPFVTDIVGHILLGLGGINTEYYDARHDVLSLKFKPCKRIVHGCVDYDKAMQNK
ncbi:MAG: phosphoethanolamine transferase [Muribaculaceae bacterium]|nr:phosphoethanolamine transferase [Muribaculaceae bacterium]